jgi:hypothetical protein
MKLTPLVLASLAGLSAAGSLGCQTKSQNATAGTVEPAKTNNKSVACEADADKKRKACLLKNKDEEAFCDQAISMIRNTCNGINVENDKPTPIHCTQHARKAYKDCENENKNFGGSSDKLVIKCTTAAYKVEKECADKDAKSFKDMDWFKESDDCNAYAYKQFGACLLGNKGESFARDFCVEASDMIEETCKGIDIKNNKPTPIHCLDKAQKENEVCRKEYKQYRGNRTEIAEECSEAAVKVKEACADKDAISYKDMDWFKKSEEKST